MSNTLTERERFRQAFLAELIAIRQEEQAGFDDQALLWLALLPLWTEDLALFCQFPTGDSSLTDFLAQAESSGLCERQQVTQFMADDEQLREIQQFWMPQARRSTIIEEISSRQESAFVKHAASTICQGVNRASAAGIPVTPDSKRWAELAEVVIGEDATQWLQKKIQSLLAEDNTGKALAWVRTATDLALAFPGELTKYIVLFNLRIELYYRQAQDKRYLQKFLRRDEQLNAFEALLDESANQSWALHYLGMGGVGKTMLLRYIHTELAQKYALAVSRVDFDYLPPDYPARQPGQLLLELAEGLRPYLHTNTSQLRAYDTFQQAIDLLQEELSDQPALSDPLANLDHPLFREALTFFIRLLNMLNERVVLVLDTCEELAKLRPTGNTLPSVVATFAIMRRIHSAYPRIRVVFAGRRPLAQAGYDWQIAKNQWANEKSYLPTHEPYLRLHLIRSFDQQEAENFLNQFTRQQQILPRPMREAIRSVSIDISAPTGITTQKGRPFLIPAPLYEQLYAALLLAEEFHSQEAGQQLFTDKRLKAWSYDLPKSASAEQTVDNLITRLYHQYDQQKNNALVMLLVVLSERFPTNRVQHHALVTVMAELKPQLLRYNPFDLDLYGNWFTEDPKLSTKMIKTGGIDPYVDARIVRRLEPPVRNLLPAVVLLRGFNAAMIRPAFTGSDEAFAQLFRALSDQEWLRVWRENVDAPPFLQVDPNLHPRLLAYYRQTTDRQKLLQAATQALTPNLKELVTQSPLSTLNVDQINGALRLLAPNEAAALWDAIEKRIAAEADWGWALNITNRLLFDEWGAASTRTSPIRAAVRATYAAAHLQTTVDYNPDQDWLDVIMTARHHPDNLLCLWLLLRGLAGYAATTPYYDRIWEFLANQSRLITEIFARSDVQLAVVTTTTSTLIKKVSWKPDAGTVTTGTVTTLLFKSSTITTWFSKLMDSVSTPLQQMSQYHIQQLVASTFYALEKLMDSAEQTNDAKLIPDPALLERGAQAVTSPVLITYAHYLRGCSFALQQRWDEAERALRKAEQVAQATEPPNGTGRQPWSDWRAPASLRDLIRLEIIRRLPRTCLRPRELRDWFFLAHQPTERMKLIDSERLLAATLQYDLAGRVVYRQDLAPLGQLDQYILERQPTCFAHQATPPFFAVLAQAWLAQGNTRQAITILQAHQSHATQSAADKQTVTEAMRGLIQVAHRMRLTDQARQLLAQQVSWTDASLDEAIWPLGAVTGLIEPGAFPQPDPSWSLSRLHAWWRSQYEMTETELAQMLPLLKQFAPMVEEASKQGYALPAALALDAQEWLLLADRLNLSEIELPIEAHYYRTLLAETTPGQKPVEQRVRLRLLLRITTLTQEEQLNLSALAKHVGLRCAAEIALEEGELLALRLPDRAVPLLQQAYAWFTEVEDWVGTTITTILLTISAIRVGNEVAARHYLSEEVQKNYRRLLRTRATLPRWRQLPALHTRNQLGSHEFADPDWHEWLYRLARCLAWAEGVAPSKLSSAHPQQPSRQFLEHPAVELSLRPQQARSPFVKSVQESLSYTTASVTARFELGRTVQGSLESTSVVTPVIEMELHAQPPTLTISWDMPPTSNTSWPWSDVAALLPPFAEAAHAIPSPIVAELASYIQAGVVPLALYVDRMLAWYPWEAVLILALRAQTQLRTDSWPAMQRTALAHGTDDLSSVELLTHAWATNTVYIMRNRAWGRLFDGAWRSAKKAVRTHEWGDANVLNNKTYQVLHLVGSIIRTTAGLHLQIGSDDANQPVAKYAGGGNGTRKSEGALVNSHQVPVTRFGLVIVQGEPLTTTVSSELPNNSRREEAAYLRAFAEEFCVAGAHNVLFIPALPPKLAGFVIEKIAAELRTEEPPTVQRLSTLVCEMRTLIARGVDTEMDLLEPALDICLFTLMERNKGHE